MAQVEDKDGLNTVASWLAGSLVVTTGILGAAGISGGNLSRVIRIHPVLFGVAITFVCLAIILGLLGSIVRKSRWRRIAILVGLFCFLGGILTLVVTYAQTTGEQDRPSVTTSLARQGDDLLLKAKVRAEGLELREYVFIVVEGMNATHQLDRQIASTMGRVPKEPGTYWDQRIYASRVGPDGSGVVDVPVEVLLTKGLYDRVRVFASIYSRKVVVPGNEGAVDDRGELTCFTEDRSACAELLLPAADAYVRTSDQTSSQ